MARYVGVILAAQPVFKGLVPPTFFSSPENSLGVKETS